MEGGFFASLHLYISIEKRPSLTILPDVHMYKVVPSNFRVAFMGSFPTKKCGDGNRCSVGVQWEEGYCFCFVYFLSQMNDNFDFGVTCSTFISLCQYKEHRALFLSSF